MDLLVDMILLIHLIMDRIEEVGRMGMGMILWGLISLEILLEVEIIIDPKCPKDLVGHLIHSREMEGLGEGLEEDLEEDLVGKIISFEHLLLIN